MSACLHQPVFPFFFWAEQKRYCRLTDVANDCTVRGAKVSVITGKGREEEKGSLGFIFLWLSLQRLHRQQRQKKQRVTPQDVCACTTITSLAIFKSRACYRHSSLGHWRTPQNPYFRPYHKLRSSAPFGSTIPHKNRISKKTNRRKYSEIPN